MKSNRLKSGNDILITEITKKIWKSFEITLHMHNYFNRKLDKRIDDNEIHISTSLIRALDEF